MVCLLGDFPETGKSDGEGMVMGGSGRGSCRGCVISGMSASNVIRGSGPGGCAEKMLREPRFSAPAAGLVQGTRSQAWPACFEVPELLAIWNEMRGGMGRWFAMRRGRSKPFRGLKNVFV